ncbi:MAG: hypothetical protein PWR24_253 [Desulfonauticus sp.]|jgi:hypothetical protein|nr:MAG: Uncharacterized protein XD41_0372 [Desulfonauticus sp. 38_4375]MDK2920696.1 hypothetical protein [Desulfonauticus sp.]
MVKIHYLPAKNCVFYRLGFCIYPEVLNPGYNQSFQCTILLKWEEEYDQLLDKAEVFGLELEKVEKIWTKKSNTRYEEIKKCPHFVEGEENFCRYLYGYTCLYELPKCKGKCKHYTLAEEG